LKSTICVFHIKITAVLKGVSFQASEGSLLCVLGKNGAGKSTLFRCILGLLKGYSGEIVIDGVSAADFPAKDLAGKIAYIPQNHSSAFSFSVFDMVMMGTTVHLGSFENPGRSQRAAAEAALDMINIGNLRNRDYCRISGGNSRWS
jgi:iron complex transport system ATP-binding protein